MLKWKYVPIVQLDRMLASDARDRGFESRLGHQIDFKPVFMGFLFYKFGW